VRFILLLIQKEVDIDVVDKNRCIIVVLLLMRSAPMSLRKRIDMKLLLSYCLAGWITIFIVSCFYVGL
jgi:hypothetical protein